MLPFQNTNQSAEQKNFFTLEAKWEFSICIHASGFGSVYSYFIVGI